MRIQGKPTLWLGTATLAVMPITALADVTPADVWSNLQAMNEALGATISADVTDAGSTLTVNDMAITWALPMGAGSVTVEYGSMTLTARGDGTVALSTADSQPVALGFEIVDEGNGRVSMEYSVSGYTTVASGDPGDITYDYSIDALGVTMGDLSLEGDMASDAEGFVLDGELTLAGLTGSYRITEGDLITVSSDGEIGSGQFNVSYEAAIEGETPVGTRSSADLGAMAAKTALSVPADGVSLMALPEALRDGFAVSYDFSADAQDSTQETYLGDELVMSQVTSVATNVGVMGLDADGLNFSGAATGYELSLTQPLMMPFPIAVAMDTLDAEMRVPLLATGAPADAVIRMVMANLTIDPELWNLFDPGERLPRDPANMSVDMTASIKLLLDLLDFDALSAMEQTGELPAEIETFTLTGLSVQAVGAAADMAGAFTFDNSDLDTFDGIPAPDGSATISLKGADMLLNTLVDMGLMTPEDVMGANMVLGGFFRPGDTADEKVTEIVVDGATGAISANGQRLR